MPTPPFVLAIRQLADEKSLDEKIIIETIEAAIAAAYRKDYGKPKQIVRAKMNPETGEFEVFQVFEVVKEVEESEHQLSIADAKKKDKKAKEGSEIVEPLPHHADFGRIAAQTAKQVIIQRLREAERDMIFAEYKDKEGQIVAGTVQQIEGVAVIVNLGKANGVMLPSDKVANEHYYTGQRLRIFVKLVESTPRGPRILVSRADPGLVKGLFTLEVPEVLAGSVEIVAIAREAGIRSKVAVKTNDPALDPIGSVVGQRGTRIQAVLAELGEEKIDIISFSDDTTQYIINSLSPAKISRVKVTKKTKKAKVFVNEDQLSLAIGRGGQNVRLASKLTGFSIDIVKEETGEEVDHKSEEKVEEEKEQQKPIEKNEEEKNGKPE